MSIVLVPQSALSKGRLEVVFQLMVWTIYFLTINVDWIVDWTSESIFPTSVPPNLAITFPFVFLINAFWLVPKFFNLKSWYRYIGILFAFLVIPESIRSIIFSLIDGSISYASFLRHLTNNSSLLFGELNFITFNMLFWSLFYRLLVDWVFIDGLTEVKVDTFSSQNNGTSLPKEANRKVKDAVFTIKRGNEHYMLSSGNVIFFQSQGDFVLSKDVDGKQHIIDLTLKTISQELGENLFYQINRGVIVNRLYVQRFSTHIKNRLKIELKDSSVFYSSNSRTPGFRKLMKNS
ncbi:MAG: LytTR family DNA-binding domain-containing protein [Bacteroidota bacterium]